MNRREPKTRLEPPAFSIYEYHPRRAQPLVWRHRRTSLIPNLPESNELGSSHDPDLIKITEIFLVPSSFLVAALGTADTNLHRAAVSALGLIVSSMWYICSREAFEAIPPPDPDLPRSRHALRTRILTFLPQVFVWGWLLSFVVHISQWNKPLGH